MTTLNMFCRRSPRRTICMLIAILLFATFALAADKPFDHQYTAYNALLSAHVSDGLVSYAKLKSDRTALDSLVSQVATLDTTGWTRDQKLALLINTYNLITIRSIVDAYPVKSIRDIPGVWDKKLWKIAGGTLTLDALEHKQIRPEFKEPRIHFALVCAAKGCPHLQPWAYRADSLEQQLRRSAEGYVRNRAFNRLDPTTGKAELSQIFDWFKDDFVNPVRKLEAFPSLKLAERSTLIFIVNHLPESERERHFAAAYRLSYLNYDWSLNERK